MQGLVESRAVFFGCRVLPVLVAGTMLTGCSHKSPPQSTWSANAGLESQLDAPVTIGTYTIKPPHGYKLHNQPVSVQGMPGDIYTWMGEKRADGTTPELEIAVINDGGQFTSQMKADTMVPRVIGTYKYTHTKFTALPTQTGIINGIPFTRGMWIGTGIRTHKEFRGSLYISVVTPEMVRIVEHDASPYNATTLPLMDAAALTIRKK